MKRPNDTHGTRDTGIRKRGGRPPASSPFRREDPALVALMLAQRETINQYRQGLTPRIA